MSDERPTRHEIEGWTDAVTTCATSACVIGLLTLIGFGFGQIHDCNVQEFKALPEINKSCHAACAPQLVSYVNSNICACAGAPTAPKVEARP